MGQYTVRTPSGDKGPFTVDHLEKLVVAGRLPATISVIEVESGLAIPLADLIVPAQTAPPPEPPRAQPAAPPASPRPATGAPRKAPQSRTGSRKSRRGGMAATPPAARQRITHAPSSHRDHSYARKKSPVAAVVLSAFVVVIVMIGAWGLLRESPGLIIEDYQKRVSGNYSTEFSRVLPQTDEFKALPHVEQVQALAALRDFEAMGGVVEVRLTAKRLRMKMEEKVVKDHPLEIRGRAGPDAFEVVLETPTGRALARVTLTPTGVTIENTVGGRFLWELTRVPTEPSPSASR